MFTLVLLVQKNACVGVYLNLCISVCVLQNTDMSVPHRMFLFFLHMCLNHTTKRGSVFSMTRSAVRGRDCGRGQGVK